MLDVSLISLMVWISITNADVGSGLNFKICLGSLVTYDIKPPQSGIVNVVWLSFGRRQLSIMHI